MISSTTPVEMPASMQAWRILAQREVAVDHAGDDQRVQRRHHAHLGRRGDAEAQEDDDQHRHHEGRAGVRKLAPERGPLERRRVAREVAAAALHVADAP